MDRVQPPSHIQALIEQQDRFFASGATRDVDFRRSALQQLRTLLVNNERRLLDALSADLRRPEIENYGSDIGTSLMELSHALRHIDTWTKPRRAGTVLATFPSHAEIHAEPLGRVLIIAPWNYPVVLTIAPLVAAIAAGNTAIVKPSELSTNSAALLAELINGSFRPEHVACIEGDADIGQALLAERWDHIFYTGNAQVGRLVLQAAAQHLTPVTLELGGKSPVIVTERARMDQAADSITSGKFWNAGQTCIAPDYVLVQRSVKTALISQLQRAITQQFGTHPQKSKDLARIINARHHRRVVGLMQGTSVLTGGEHDEADLYVAPTLIDSPALDSPLMQQEIFGPLLPVLAYDTLDDAIRFVNQRDKPLALYLFSWSDEERDRVLTSCSFGGGCINDTLTQFVPPGMPFGGVGASGMGRYHGKAGFDTFSNHKSILVNSPLALDWLVRLKPYRGWQQTLLRALLR